MEQYRVFRHNKPLSDLVETLVKDLDEETAKKVRAKAEKWIHANIGSYLDYWPDA